MNNKELIVHLIREDMRFNQFMAALRKLGIEIYGHDPDFMSLIGKLLQVKEAAYDSWMELYVTEINKCESLPIEPLGRNLYTQSVKCYDLLVEFNQRDNYK